MKKYNNRGYMLVETLVATTVIVTTLLLLYVQFVNITNNYEEGFSYNSVNNMYAVSNIQKYILEDGYERLVTGLETNEYIDITSCPATYFTDRDYCLSLFSGLKVKQVLFTNEMVGNISFNVNDAFKKFIKKIVYDDAEEYRILAEFEDATFGTMLLFKDGYNEAIKGDETIILPSSKTQYSLAIGDVVKLGNEEFYYVGATGTGSTAAIKLLAKYNINVGGDFNTSWTEYTNPTNIQDSTAKGYVSAGKPYKGVTLFALTSKWSGTYPLNTNNFSNADMLALNYAKTYANTLIRKYPYLSNYVTSRLISYDELVALGCVPSSATCKNGAGKWLYSSTYWTSTANSADTIWYVDSTGKMTTLAYTNQELAGIRPVVELKRSAIEGANCSDMYIVTLNPNGGTVSSSTLGVSCGGLYGLIPSPTRSGYIFLGWKNSAGTFVNAASNVENKNHTLTAEWQKAPTVYTISKNLTDVIDNTSSITTITEGTSVTLKFVVDSSQGTCTFLPPTVTGATHTWNNGTLTLSNPTGNVTINVSADCWFCFVAGTQVLTETGYKNIEDIKIGEKVYSLNLDTNETELSAVTKTILSSTDTTYIMTIGGKELELTPKHELYIIDKGFVRAFNVKVGDMMLDKNGNEVVISKIVEKKYAERIPTYNLTVAGNHNYFVTEIQVLVHNAVSPT